MRYHYAMTDDPTALEQKEPGSKLAESVAIVAHVLTGAARGTRRYVGTHMTVGKSQDNHLVLPDRTVSRHHCELVRTTSGIELRDLGSTNGTRVDGTQVTSAVVKPGSTVRVGEVEIALRPSAQPLSVLPSERQRFGDAVGRSLAMRTIFGVLEFMAPSDATILLEGETGTGKDALARAVLAESRRKKGPFQVLDCGVVSANLLESELFGHEKGAFTGAATARRGIFEAASGGTVFLDEIDELPLDLQPKLLRVIEAREIKRLGSSKPIKIDVRLIAASKRDLVGAVADGRFREDLYFRLAVVPIQLPPLRARRDDIPLLVTTMLAALGGKNMSVNDEVMSEFLAREWRGNVRELRNVLERALHLARGQGTNEIDVCHLPALRSLESTFRFEPGRSFDETMRACERAYARWLVTMHGSEEAAAAEAQLELGRLMALIDD